MIYVINQVVKSMLSRYLGYLEMLFIMWPDAPQHLFRHFLMLFEHMPYNDMHICLTIEAISGLKRWGVIFRMVYCVGRTLYE